MFRPALAATLLLAGPWACATSAPPPQVTRPTPLTTAPGPDVPPGCEANLTGRYVHGGHPGFRYQAEDDGGTLRLTLLHAPAGLEDGGEPGVVLSLQRTPKGFLGEASATALQGAQPCPVRFATEVVACSDAGVTLKSAASVAIDDRCQSPPAGPPVAMVEQSLRREGPDGGLPGADVRLPPR